MKFWENVVCGAAGLAMICFIGCVIYTVCDSLKFRTKDANVAQQRAAALNWRFYARHEDVRVVSYFDKHEHMYCLHVIGEATE